MVAIEETVEPEPLKRGGVFVPWRLFVIASLVICVLLVGGLVAYKLRGSPVDRGSRALIDAFSSRRLIEPRLSSGFKGGEFRPSIADRSNISLEKLAKAGELIRDSLAKGDLSAQLPYARLLLLSEDQKLPEALKYLRRAVASAPESAEAHNDLGVGLIEQGKLEDALDEFETALNGRADMPEALFNRALCYRRLLLTDAANTDLGRLGEIERDQGWLAEARRLRDELSSSNSARPADKIIEDLNKALADDLSQAREIVDRNYAVVRSYFFFDLAQQYLQSAATHDQATADLALSRMEKISRLAVEIKDDRDMADTVTRLIAVPEQERADELKLFRGYKKAYDLFVSRKYDESLAVLEPLKKVFQKQGDSLFQAKVKYFIAASLYGSGHFATSVALFEETLPLFEANGWLYHQATTLEMIGLVYSRLGQDSKAIEYFQQSYDLFQKMREPVAAPLQYVGLAYWHLGNFDKALEHLHTSTDLFLKQGSHAEQLANNYLNIADVYRLLDRSRLALLFADEALKYSNKAHNMSRAAQTSSFKAVERARARQFDLAEADIKQAFEELERVSPAERTYTEPLVLVRAGETAVRRDDIAGAIRLYTDAESLTSRAEGDAILRINALRGRADAYAREGQRDLARKDLDEAIRIVEGYRKNLIGRVHRMEFLGASQSVFDQMILLDADEPGRASEAFEMSERSRARSLLDEFAPKKSAGPQTARPLSLAEVKAALPDKLALLVYSVTSERTHLFLVTRKGFEVATSRATAAQLERLVNDYVSKVETASLDELSKKARELYQLLIEPVRERLTGNTELCIVPDKSLQLLPMAVLRDSSDRYLVESFRLLCAPSASVFIRCLNDVKVARGEERLLAVGEPEFNQEKFPNLPDLPDARIEADGAALVYRNPIVLKGADATKSKVCEAMKNCVVAHLAVHCLINQQSPWLAALVLAPERKEQNPSEARTGDDLATKPNASASDSSKNADMPVGSPKSLSPETPVSDPANGLLYLNEVYKLNLPVTRLVVLSACETGLGHYYGGEGIVSLIHPFLAARVSTVVASLWPVESRATSELMIDFHKERRTFNKRASDALRAAQMKMIESADFAHPYYWASFIVVGGDY